MPNMSYCRFENTLGDLEDCMNALEDGVLDNPELSESERESALQLIELCGDIYGNFSKEAEEDEWEEDDDVDNIAMEYIHRSEDRNK